MDIALHPGSALPIVFSVVHVSGTSCMGIVQEAAKNKEHLLFSPKTFVDMASKEGKGL